MLGLLVIDKNSEKDEARLCSLAWQFYSSNLRLHRAQPEQLREVQPYGDIRVRIFDAGSGTFAEGKSEFWIDNYRFMILLSGDFSENFRNNIPAFVHRYILPLNFHENELEHLIAEVRQNLEPASAR